MSRPQISRRSGRLQRAAVAAGALTLLVAGPTSAFAGVSQHASPAASPAVSTGAPLAVKHPLQLVHTSGGKTTAGLSAHAAGTAQAGLALPRVGGQGWSLDNGQMDIDISPDGRFTAGSDGLNGYQILFGWPSDPWTSYTSVRVDGDDVILANAETTNDPAAATADRPATGAYDQRSWWVDGVIVTQTLTLVANPATGNFDAVHMVWRLTSGDGAPHVAGVRTLLDDDVHHSDGAVFHVPGVGEPTAETDLVGASVPDRLTLYPSDTDATHVASAFLFSAIDTRPDRLVIAHWPSAYGSAYDYEPDPTLSLGADSAYLAYWQNRSVTASASVAVATTYGIGRLISDVRPPLAVTIDAPPSYTAIPATSSDHAYSPDQMTVAVSVTNSSTTSAESDVHLQLLMPAGLTASWTSHEIGNLAPSQSSYVSFLVHASARPVAAPVTYTLRVFDAIGYKDVPITVQVPAATLVPVNYVALGDSYSAGEGTQASGFVDDNVSKCNRTYAAYGNYITRPGDVQPLAAEARQQFPGIAYTFAACSNAYIEDVVNLDNDNRHRNGQNPHQAEQVNSVNAGTNLITMTISGNNVGFRSLLIACLTLPDCADQGVHFTLLGHTYQSPTLVSSTYGQIAKQKQRLIALFAALHKAAPAATIVVAGYPQIFSALPQPGCGQSLGGVLTTSELAFIRTATTKLNAVIQQAASAGGVGYVDPDPQFAGHQLCAGGDDYFIGLLHSLTGGSSWTNSFHPTAAGQLAYATAFNQWLAANGVGPLHSLVRGFSAPAADVAEGKAAAKVAKVGLRVEEATVAAAGAALTPACSSVTVSPSATLTVDADGFAAGKAVRVDLLIGGRTVTDAAPGAKAGKTGHLHALVAVPASARYTTSAAVQVVGLAPGKHALVTAFGGFTVAKNGVCKPVGRYGKGSLSLFGSSASTAAVRVDRAKTTVSPGGVRTLTLPVGVHTLTLLGHKGSHLVAVSRIKVRVTSRGRTLVVVTGAATGRRLAVLQLKAVGLTSEQAQVTTLSAGSAPALQVSLGTSGARASGITTTAGKRLLVRVWRGGSVVATLDLTLLARQRLVVVSVGTGSAVATTKLLVSGEPRWS